VADVVAGYLKRELFEVHLAHDGHSALTLAREVDPDVVILDIGLPGVDGIEVCRQLRVFSDAYVIMLTARDTEVDTIVGLSVGRRRLRDKNRSAPAKLVARVRAVLRRPRRTPTHGSDPGQELSPPRVFGALRINIDSREVHIDDTPVMLTRTEFDVLAALSSRPGAVLSRRQLLETVWGDSWVGNDNIIDVHVGHLRRKLGDNPSYRNMSPLSARRVSNGRRLMMFSRRPTRGPGIRMRLLVANSVVVIASIATTSVVAAIVGPPMFRRLMDKAVVPASTAITPMSAPSAMRPRFLWVSRWECRLWRR